MARTTDDGRELVDQVLDELAVTARSAEPRGVVLGPAQPALLVLRKQFFRDQGRQLGG